MNVVQAAHAVGKVVQGVSPGNALLLGAILCLALAIVLFVAEWDA